MTANAGGEAVRKDEYVVVRTEDDGRRSAYLKAYRDDFMTLQEAEARKSTLMARTPVRTWRHAVERLATPTDAGLRDAAHALIDKLAEVHESPEYRGVWDMARIHGVKYKGPTYAAEEIALRAALSQGGGE